MKLRISLLALLSALGAALTGCAGPRVNLWPLYFQETRAAPEAPHRRQTHTEILYPLVVIENDGVRRYHALRPLYNYESNRAEKSHRLQYLWPLGLLAGKEGEHSIHRLFPFFQYATTTKRATGEKASHGLVFPILFWSHHPRRGASFAVFPLGGVTHRLLGETFSFVLFPVYSYYRQRDYERYNLLWPFFSIGATPDGDRKLLRIWPLYVHNRHSGVYDHHYLLWPLVRWGTQQWSLKETEYVRSYFAFHPFFSTQTTRDSEGKAVAWQRQVLFLTYRTDTREREQKKGWSFLWSLVRSESSPGRYDFRFFPFYWQTTRYARGAAGDSGGRQARYRILWPLIWVEKNNLRVYEEDSNFLVAPFYWHYTRRYTGGEHAGRTQRSITLWPLATLKNDPDGSSHFWTPSHGWKDASQGYKRNYRPLLDLFQYHRGADDMKEIRILSRLYHHKFGPDGTYLSLPLLLEYDSIGDEGAGGEKSCSMLLGLVKYCWSETGRRWRLFYIPL